MTGFRRNLRTSKMNFKSLRLDSRILLSLLLINIVNGFSSDDDVQTDSTFVSGKAGGRGFFYIPSILEIDLGVLNELVTTGHQIKLSEPGFSYISFDEFFRRFCVRISCISKEGSKEDFILLNETIRRIHELNRNVNDSSQHLEMFLSIFPGLQKNDYKYNEYMLYIKQVLELFPGIVTNVLLDLSSIDIGPLDGFSLTQKWKLCHNVGVMRGFSCGFVFDTRILPSKASVLGFLHIAHSSPVFLHESENNTGEKQYDELLDPAVHALFQNELKFGGLFINNKVTVNDTHFHIERLKMKWEYRSAPAIYKVVTELNNFKDQVRICSKNNMTSYSDLSSNRSSSAIISITAENLLPLLTGRVNLLADTDDKYSFMQIFSRFHVLISGDKFGEEKNVSLFTLFTAVMSFSVENKATYHLRPLRLFIGFTPEGEIEKELNAVVKLVAEINKNLPGTVEAVILDYNYLRVNYQTVSVVRNDVINCNKIAASNTFKCGFIFHQRNCFRSSALLSSVPFANNSMILLRGEKIRLNDCVQHFRNFKLGFVPLATPGAIIEANFQNETFSYGADDISWIETFPTLYIPWLVRADIPRVEHSDEQLSIKDWLLKPTVFSSNFISFAVSVNDLNSTALPQLVTKQNDLTVVINDIKHDDLHKLVHSCPVNPMLVGAPVIIIILMYSPDIADDLNSFDRFKSSLTTLNSQCGKVISEVVISWDQCNSDKNCLYANPWSNTGKHFYGVSNITRFVAKLKSLNVKVGLLISRTTWLLLSSVDSESTTQLGHFEETVGITTDVGRNINTREVLEMAQQFDKFVFEHIYEMTTIQIVGAYLAAKHVVAIFEEIVRSEWLHIKGQERFSIKLNIIECQYGNSWNGSVQYVRFLEIVNNWAVVMEYKVIIDLLYDPYSVYDCGNKSDSSYSCGCGFWTRDELSGNFVDRKSLLKLYFDEKTKETRNTSVTNKPTTDTLLMPIALALFVSIVIFVFVIKIYRKRYVFSIQKTMELRHQMAQIPNIFVEIFPDSIIGRGNSKTVIRKGAIISPGSRTLVAVKDFTATNDRGRISGEDFATLKGLISEAQVMQDLDMHTNILRFYGVSKGRLRKGKLQLVLEYCPMGSLDELLKALSNLDISSDRYVNLDRDMLLDSLHLQTTMLRWSVEIASGLEYLASKRIVHGDIAARNILLVDGLCCKICDFGLSKRLENYEYYIQTTQESLPWRWMAPEGLRKQIFNEKTDVWMYGITLWEIYTLGEVPYGGLAWSNEFLLMLEGGLRPELPSSMPRETMTLVTDCLAINSEQRPNFSMVKRSLGEA